MSCVALDLAFAFAVFCGGVLLLSLAWENINPKR